MERLSQAYGRLLDGLMLVACLLLLAMALLIGADVVGRNAGLGGIAWSGEVSEDILYLIDAVRGPLAAAPGPAHPGRHPAAGAAAAARLAVRVGRRSLGARLLALFHLVRLEGARASYQAGAITIKTLVTPEWWLLAPLPLAFLLLAVEFLFRMHRLSRAERAPRTDAVSAS